MLTIVGQFISDKELLRHDASNVRMLDTFTGLNLSLRVAQLKLRTSKCMTEILKFLEPSRALQMQLISKKFYAEHVPAIKFQYRNLERSTIISHSGIN